MRNHPQPLLKKDGGRSLSLGHIEDVQDWFVREKTHLAHDFLFVFSEFNRVGHLPLLKHGKPLGERGLFKLELLCLSSLQLPSHGIESFLYRPDIGHGEFDFNRLNIPGGVDVPFHMMHVCILKCAHNMHDHVDLTNIGEELVAQPFSLVCSFHQSGNVNKFDRCLDYFFRLRHLCQDVNAVIWHLHHTDVWFDRTKWKICTVDLLFCERFEESGLADIRQSDDSNLQHIEAEYSPPRASCLSFFVIPIGATTICVIPSEG